MLWQSSLPRKGCLRRSDRQHFAGLRRCLREDFAEASVEGRSWSNIDAGLLLGRRGAAELARFDRAVHVPRSENCGGVVEPFSAGVPVIAAAVGGLPEVVIDNVTGRIVRDRSPKVLAQNISQILATQATGGN